MMVQMAANAELIVDLDQYRENLTVLRSLAPTALQLAVVKANAYGHGMLPVARAARDVADWLGVATGDEALELRAGGDSGPLLCWLAAPGAPFAQLIAADVEVTASAVSQLEEIAAAGRAKVQLKVDTGLSRGGARGHDWDELVQAAARLQRTGRIEVTGIWSHFACADEPANSANEAQEAAFRQAITQLEAAGIEPGIRHLANSAATVTRPSAHFDLVRVGIASYGISPSPTIQVPGVRPVLTAKAKLAQVKRIEAGTGVSYGYRWIADHETTVGLVPVGYGDGIFRTASPGAEVGFNSARIPVRGTICMDQFVVELGEYSAKPGDMVTLFGPGDDGEPTAQDWADAAGTIAYEIVTRLSGRWTRTYLGTR